MTSEPPSEATGSLRDLIFLRRTRALVGGRQGLALVAGVGAIYALVALLVGGMLQFVPTGARGTSVQVLSYASTQWWNFPALLVVTPSAVLELPYFATLTMVVAAAGVGLGMGAGLVLAYRVFRRPGRAPAGAGAAGTVAGLTPALLALLTLGACCSTSAAAVAGVTAIAQSTGTSPNTLFVQTWFLNVFQLVILGVALLAQERLVTLYGALVGIELRPAPAGAEATRSSTGTLRVRLPVVALRVVLVAAGTLWALAGLIELTAPPGDGPTTALVAVVLLQHPLLGGIAIGAGLAPASLLALTRPRDLYGLPGVFRLLLILIGLSVAVGVPPPLVGWGASGLGNEILGARGVSPAGGGTPIPAGDPATLAIAYAVLFAGIGLFAVAVALDPRRWIGRLGGPPDETPALGIGPPLGAASSPAARAPGPNGPAAEPSLAADPAAGSG